jgi:hypothetical protein
MCHHFNRLKDAGIIDGKNITTTMTGIAFSKVAG